MNRLTLTLIGVIGLLLLVSSTALAAPVVNPSSQAANLTAPAPVTTTFKVNVVFVGYAQTQINMSNLQSQLPTEYSPLIRYPNFYDIRIPLGIQGTYAFNYVFAPNNFNNAFFSYLTSIGTSGPLTQFQDAYNHQVHKVPNVSVTPQVLYIDAPSTERYLETHARDELGLDIGTYTIFFVNWYGRSDFKFHVYTKTDSPDPDTNYNFGINRQSRKIIAWGGSFGRGWFYDLSAGPESWTDNWNVDDADVDGDHVADYRMPPIWEYGNTSGYRPFTNLSGDLGKILRYVALDMLFTSSPLYDPLATEPLPGYGKRAFVTMWEDYPNSSNGFGWVKPNWIKVRLAALQPQFNWTVRKGKDLPLVGPPKRAFRIWSDIVSQNDCWNQFGTTFAELFCFFNAFRDQYLPPIKVQQPNIGGVFAFYTTDARMGDEVGLLGYADDNWISGYPTYVFIFDTPEDRALGYGFTWTLTHEYAHHIGMSHPHDGYDSTSGVDFDATGPFYFAWSGDESETIMSYIRLSNNFGWFERDNMNRFYAARVLLQASQIAAQVRQSQNAAQVAGLLKEGNSHLSLVKGAFDQGDYEKAANEARAGLERILRAAETANIKVQLGAPTGPGGQLHHPKYVDRIPPKAKNR